MNRFVTTSMVGLKTKTKNGQIRKNLTKMANLRDIGGNAEKEEEEEWADLVQSLYGRYYCTLHFDTSAYDTDLDSKS